MTYFVMVEVVWPQEQRSVVKTKTVAPHYITSTKAHTFGVIENHCLEAKRKTTLEKENNVLPHQHMASPHKGVFFKCGHAKVPLKVTLW